MDFFFLKVCCFISVHEKALPAPGFPQGWFYVIEEPRKDGQNAVLDGLTIIAPTRTRYRSVEAAKNHHRTRLKDFPRVSEVFYGHIGVAGEKVPRLEILV